MEGLQQVGSGSGAEAQVAENLLSPREKEEEKV